MTRSEQHRRRTGAAGCSDVTRRCRLAYDDDGWAAPSLLAAVREGAGRRCDRRALDGDAVRGMPGRRSQARVAADLDAIDPRLVARAAVPWSDRP